jgi:hypothetical protein
MVVGSAPEPAAARRARTVASSALGPAATRGEDADGGGVGAIETRAHCGGGGRGDGHGRRFSLHRDSECEEEKGAGSRRGGELWRGRVERGTMAAM